MNYRRRAHLSMTRMLIASKYAIKEAIAHFAAHIGKRSPIVQREVKCDRADMEVVAIATEEEWLSFQSDESELAAD